MTNFNIMFMAQPWVRLIVMKATLNFCALNLVGDNATLSGMIVVVTSFFCCNSTPCCLPAICGEVR